MSSKLKSIYAIIKYSIIILLCFLLFLIYLLFYYNEDLPDYRQLTAYNPAVVSRLYTSDGLLLEEYAKEHRIFVPIELIPKDIINAFIAAEDKNFYTHSGVDFTSILRAAIFNLANLVQSKPLAGGSTITQQVVKNFLLTNERSLKRKIKEAILSFRISQVYSKDRILELYLNQIYLGGKSYGIASAALNYFNKSVEELNLEEIAYLAALPKAPNNYDIVKNYHKAKARRDWVLERMHEENFITINQVNNTKKLPIVFNDRNVQEIFKSPFFAETVRRDLVSKFDSKTLYEDGLTIFTTIDPKLQKIADNSFRRAVIEFDRRSGYRGVLEKNFDTQNWQEEIENIALNHKVEPYKIAVVLSIEKDRIKIGLQDQTTSFVFLKDFLWANYSLKEAKDLFKKGDIIAVEKNKKNNKVIYSLAQIPEVNGGMVVIDVKTGKVLAMVGGFSSEDSEFNRVIQAKRQPGSVFKTFVYLAALEQGMSPSSLVLDGPIELSQGAGLEKWKPKNYSNDYMGMITLRTGLEKSRNLITVRLALNLGIKKIINIAKRFGIYNKPERNFSIALGAQETTLIDITSAYAIIANYGKKIQPYMVEYIKDRHGNFIYRNDRAECFDCAIKDETLKPKQPTIEINSEQVIDQRTAYQMISILEGVIKRGTAIRASSLQGSLAGKTGTTNDSKDAWFIGFDKDIVIGTYLGYDKPKSLGSKETGSSVALPAFIYFMEQYLKDKQALPFKIPKGLKLVKTDVRTGKASDLPISKTVIYESYKTNEVEYSKNDNISERNINDENLELKKYFLKSNNFDENSVNADLEGIY